MGVANETWVVTEGAAGMENQCLGLAERLPFPIRTFRVRLKQPWRALAPYSIGSPLSQVESEVTGLNAPWPRILIGCGRQSIPFSRAIKRASGGNSFTVQCQDPRVSVGCFDLVVPAEHDELSGPNVFPIIGSPNRITRVRLAEARAQFGPLLETVRGPRVAVLVGGASRTHGSLDAAAADRLGAMLAQAAIDHGLMLSTSRRTPAEAALTIGRHLANTDAFIWDGTGENPYSGMLAWADAFVVTADSVNMICEAAGTGKPVHVFPLPGGNRKAQLFQKSLADRRITRQFNGEIQQWSYPPLEETRRVVDHIRTLLDLPTPPSDMQVQGP